MTDDEIIAEANRLGVKAPIPLKMAAVEVMEARSTKASFAHSSLPIETQPEYAEKRRRIDFWTARWQGGNNGPAGPLGIDLNVPDDLEIGSSWPVGRLILAAAIFGPPVIYVIMLWWRWWLS